MSEDLCRLDLENAKIAKTSVQVINANWKLVVENNFECYHCVFAHPQYSKVHYADRNSMRPELLVAYQKEGLESGALSRELRSAANGDDWGHSHPDAGIAWFRSVRFPFRSGIQSETLHKSGRAVSIAQGTLKGDARAAAAFGSVQMMTAYNFYSHSSCDYTMTMKLEPLSATQTRLTRTFLVHPDAVEGEHYTLLDVDSTNSEANCGALEYVWDVTFKQDIDLILAVAKGTSSDGYTSGPLNSAAEPNVVQWHKWYRAKMKAAPAPPLASLEW
jgi:Rieske 2Fe-2S family protein